MDNKTKITETSTTTAAATAIVATVAKINKLIKINTRKKNTNLKIEKLQDID